MEGVNAPSCHLYIPVYPTEWRVVKNNYAEAQGPRYKVNSRTADGKSRNGIEQPSFHLESVAHNLALDHGDDLIDCRRSDLPPGSAGPVNFNLVDLR